MYINEIAINVFCSFKIYNHVICDDKKQLWQLETCPRKRTIPLRKLTFNNNRKAYRINGNWVSKDRLLKLRIENKYKIKLQEGKETPFD